MNTRMVNPLKDLIYYSHIKISLTLLSEQENLQRSILTHPVISPTSNSHSTSHHCMRPSSHILTGLPTTTSCASNKLHGISTFSLPTTICHTTNLTGYSQPTK